MDDKSTDNRMKELNKWIIKSMENRINGQQNQWIIELMNNRMNG